ncbi:MAG TPA: thioesterase family protein [Steroidobacteraceae bacterium]|nr:thioesterase family protein [Steroidobacteraceae bacterium]
MDALTAYRVAIEPAWIDYNGHLRDAYYGVAFSLAIDDVMDQLGIDEAYRGRTRCTLYTLETHCHFLHEVKASDELAVRTLVLDHDRKRLLAAGVFECSRVAGPVAVAEALLLHVHQGEHPASAPMPAGIEARLAGLKLAAAPTDLPRSRALELRRR